MEEMALFSGGSSLSNYNVLKGGNLVHASQKDCGKQRNLP